MALSRREREVAALVTEGLTNREIADRLFISERTAEYHVEQLRNKLGVHSRSEVGDAMRRRALDGAATAPRLPAELTGFVGRRQELDEVRRLLARNRLVTVAGPPGMGKTRLAQRVAHEASPDFPGGVVMVELAPVADPGAVIDAVASALGAPAADGIGARLPKQPFLLVVDNCEHVVNAAAAAVESVLEAGSAVRVLATSRVPLRAAGEVAYRLRGLREAEQLFSECAARAAPGIVASEAVARICARLEGVPLAIELAAARAGVMSLEEIDSALAKSISLLTSGRRTADARQRSLRAAIQSSYDLLTPDQQRMFARLSVFTGDFTLEAATEVCGEGLDEAEAVLLDLADASLVAVTTDQHGGSRYRLLVSIRHFAAEALEASEEERVRARHFEHYRRFFAIHAADHIQGRPPGRNYADLVERDLPNVRSALAWGIPRRPEKCVEMLVDVHWYWALRGSAAEADDLISAALATGAGSDEDRADLFWAGGMLAARRGDTARALRHHDEGIEIFRRHGNWSKLARVLNNRAVIAPSDAAQHLAEAEEYARRSGDPGVIGLVASHLGDLARRNGDLGAARAGLEAGLALRREAGLEWGIWRSLVALAHLAMDEGRLRDWPDLLAEALAIVIDLTSEPGLASVLFAYARGTTDAALALRLGGRARALQHDAGEDARDSRQMAVAERLARARDELGDERATAEEIAGEAMTLEEARQAALDAGEAARRRQPPPTPPER